eukprot:231944-Pelagomonas_calceolata.AAC.1
MDFHILLISLISRVIPLIEGDTQVGKICLHIPSNNPLWKDGIVPILNSGKTLDAMPCKPARLGYLSLHELATSATQSSHNSDLSTILLRLETASSAKAMSILIQWNGGV